MTEDRLREIEARANQGYSAETADTRALIAEVRRLQQQLSPRVRDDTKNQKPRYAVPESFKESAKTFAGPTIIPIVEDIEAGRVSDEQVAAMMGEKSFQDHAEALLEACRDVQKPGPKVMPLTPEQEALRRHTSEINELRAAVKGLFDRMDQAEPAHNSLVDRVAALESFENGVTPHLNALLADLENRKRANFPRQLDSQAKAIAQAAGQIADIETRLDLLEEADEEAIPFERLACFIRSLGGVALPHAIFNEWKALMEMLN